MSLICDFVNGDSDPKSMVVHLPVQRWCLFDGLKRIFMSALSLLCGATPRHGRQSARPSFSPGIELLYGLVTIFYSLSSFCLVYRFVPRLCVSERVLNVAAGLTAYALLLCFRGLESG